jgi:hypothetical protein
LGWDTLGNGTLIAAAEQAGFDVLITCDKNIRYQQNLKDRRIALVVLDTTRWLTIRAEIACVIEAINAAIAGSYRHVAFDRPPLRRRNRERLPEP